MRIEVRALARRSVALRSVFLWLALAFGPGVGSAGAQEPSARPPAGRGAIAGRVTEQGSGRPVAEAQVLLPGSGAVATSDSSGRFRIASVPAGEVRLRLRRIGYMPAERAVVVPVDSVAVIEVELAQAVTELDPVVVTATREPRSLADVPAAVSVVDTTTLQAGRTAGLHEALRYTPGVKATSRFGLDDVNLSIRGSGIRTSFGVRGVAVIVDGVPVTEPDGQTRLDLIELAAARQVEVVRGPASALYGGAASGGAVNIISRSGAESRGLTARALTGSFGFRKYDLSFGTPIGGERGAVYLSGTHTSSDGFRVHNENEINRLNLRADYRLARGTRIGVEASGSDLDMRIPGSLTLDEFRADPSQAQPSNVANDYARRDERYRAGIRLDQELGRAEASAYFFYGGRVLDHPIFQVLDQNLHRTQVGAKARLPLGGGAVPVVRLTGGFDYDNVYGEDRRYANQGGRRGALVASGHTALPNLGLYGQVEARLLPRVTATAGLRYDRVRYDLTDYLDPARSAERTFEELSPKGTVSYQFDDGTSLYLSVARGFEPPTASELTASADPTRPLNTALEPQRLVNYEVGVKTLLGERVFLDAAVYRTDIEGEFLSRTVPTPDGQPRTVYENAGESRHLGLELGVTALLTGWLDAVGSYTWSDFELRRFTDASGRSYAGKRLPGVPVHRLAGELRVRPVEGLAAGLGVEWQGRVYVDNANTERGVLTVRGEPVAFGAVDPYALAHLNASYRWRGATIFVSVENLFDRTYVGNVAANASDGRFYAAGAGRYLAVGMSLAAARGGF
ncbi:MAG TPA: TonB-dependent receptor [Gemmatimonadales bacterium]|nr:TonB-dependent receptor [Gemmatimonadales bacterium]